LLLPCAIVVASLALPPSAPLAIAFLLSAAAALALFLSLKARRRQSREATRAASLAALGLAIGGLIVWRGIADEAARHWGLPPRQIASIEAKLVHDPLPLAGDRARLDLELLSARDAMGREAASRGPFSVIALGASESPHLAALEGLAAGSGVRVALRLGSAASEGRATSVEARSIEMLNSGAEIEALRAGARAAILRLASSAGEAGGLVAALALGDRSSLEGELKDAFSRAGCIHILALSGMHLSLIAFALGAALRPLLGARLAAAGSIALLFAYSYLTGMCPSIMRSFAMFGAASLLGAIGAERDARRTLCIAFIALAAIDPGAARTLSFRLSFLAMGGIAFWAKPLAVLLGKRLPRALAGLLSQGIAAQLAVSPVLCLEFASLSAASVPASLLVAPLALAFMGTGMAFIAIAALGSVLWLAEALAWALGALENAIRAVLALFEGLPTLALPDEASRWAALACLALFGLFLYRCHAHDGLPRLRLATRYQGPPRIPRHERAEALRAEFPRQ
jgi:competence protein ComEC